MVALAAVYGMTAMNQALTTADRRAGETSTS
jgi:hypothetical protein